MCLNRDGTMQNRLPDTSTVMFLDGAGFCTIGTSEREVFTGLGIVLLVAIFTIVEILSKSNDLVVYNDQTLRCDQKVFNNDSYKVLCPYSVSRDVTIVPTSRCCPSLDFDLLVPNLNTVEQNNYHVWRCGDVFESYKRSS